MIYVPICEQELSYCKQVAHQLCTQYIEGISSHSRSLPLMKEEVHVFARVCLSACVLARLLKNACMNLDEMLHLDRCQDMDELINF